jgi:hypothetical protein
MNDTNHEHTNRTLQIRLKDLALLRKTISPDRALPSLLFVVFRELKGTT